MFKKFPEFTKLNLNDKDYYNKLTSSFPPYSDLLFSTLNIWWNLDNKLEVSLLNGNLVINYYISGDGKNSGYGLIGIKNVSNSINTIFHYLESIEKQVKLVHVPEFVVEKINQSHLKGLSIAEERDYSEYILSTKLLAKLEGKNHSNIRYKVNRFRHETEDKICEIRYLDLSSDLVKNEITQFIKLIEQKHPSANDSMHNEHKALGVSLEHAKYLGLKCLALYVNNDLCAISIHDELLDKKFYVGHHLKVNYDFSGASEYMCHEISKRLLSKGIEYLNIEMDLGIENLKTHKMGLNPIGFLKKYIIQPSGRSGD